MNVPKNARSLRPRQRGAVTLVVAVSLVMLASLTSLYSARTVLQRSRSLDVEMPITECVVDLLDGRIRPDQAVAQLMGREPGSEGARA